MYEQQSTIGWMVRAAVRASTAGFLAVLVLMPAFMAAAECPELLGRVGRGQVKAVAAGSSGLAVIGSGTVLETVGISDPTAPQRLGSVELGAPILEIETGPAQIAYVATELGLHIVDVMDPVHPRLLQRVLADDIRGIAVGAQEIFLARATSGVTVVDVSDPASPVERGTFDRQGIVTDVKLDGNLLFTAESDTGVGAVDVSDSTSPDELGFVTVSDRELRSLALTGDHALVADANGAMLVLDVSAPADPRIVGELSGLNEPTAVATDGDHAYLSDHGDGLVVVSLSDPANPVVSGRIEDGDSDFTADVAVADGFVLLADTLSALWIVDPSDPANPEVVGGVIEPSNTDDVELAHHTAVVIDASVGLRTVDVTDPLHPRTLARFPLDGAQSVAVIGSTAVVGMNPLTTLDITDPAKPKVVGASSGEASLRDMSVQGSLVVGAGWDQGLQLFDVADPARPFEVGSVMTGGVARGVAVSGVYAYVAADEAGLEIVDFSDPANPSIVGSLDLDAHSLGAVVSDNVVFVAAVTRLYAVDVSDPTSPVLLHDFDIAHRAADVDLLGNLLVVASPFGSVEVYDVSAPSAPVHLGRAYTPGSAVRLSRSGSVVAVADSDAGLALVDVSGCFAADSEPFADFAWQPSDPVAGLPVQFSDLSGGDPSSWSWTFGDGATSTVAEPSHVYGSPGSYEVTLEVSNAKGTDTDSAAVVVNGTSAPAVDQAGSYRAVVPAGAHVEGLEATRWVTDLELHAPGVNDVEANVYWLEGAGDNSAAVGRQYEVEANESLRLADVVLSQFGSASANGALLIGSNRPLVVSSRTYNAAGEAGTYGQYIAGYADDVAIEQGEEARIVQLAHDPEAGSGFRTNIGAASLSAQPMAITVELLRADGTEVGSFDLDLGPYGHRQSNAVFDGLVPGTVEGGYALVSSGSAGARFFAYASVVDNGSGDPIYVPARVP